MRMGFGKTVTRDELHTEQQPDLRRWLRDHPDGGRWVGVNGWEGTTPFEWQGHWLSILDWNGFEGRNWVEVMDPLTSCEFRIDVGVGPDVVKAAVDDVRRELSERHYDDLLPSNQQLHAWDAWLERNKEAPTNKACKLMARACIDLYNRHQANLPGEFRYKFAELVNSLSHESE